ncbi:hypothetical protein BDR05DRAFT_967588 [Suillus weaverae]|nr:hypothetical protein BDR05DRAFT_967588 [Suillus weaverae]
MTQRTRTRRENSTRYKQTLREADTGGERKAERNLLEDISWPHYSETVFRSCSALEA